MKVYDLKDADTDLCVRGRQRDQFIVTWKEGVAGQDSLGRCRLVGGASYTRPLMYTQPQELLADTELLEYICAENVKEIGVP
jgi:hypothetical protein